MTTFYVGRPNVGDLDLFQNKVDSIFKNNRLTNDGPLVRELEQKLADYIGVKHCIAMCNGTVALELAIRANGLSGEVIVPSMTFIAGPHALQWQGIKPVFADIDEQTLNLSLASVEERITPLTTGIIPVHLYGRPCDIQGLQSLADSYGLRVLFDSAHAIGCSYHGTRIGNFGACEVFSFHATKVFNCFEGGAVTTNDDELANKLRLMRNFGFQGEDNVSYIGTNGKMSEICAAMGLVNLDNLEGFIVQNKRNYEAFLSGLKNIPGITMLTYDETEQNNYQYVILRIDDKFSCTRDRLKQELEHIDVMARRYFYPGCHRMEPYKTLYPNYSDRLPITEQFSEEVLALPTGSQMSVETIARICDLISTLSNE